MGYSGSLVRAWVGDGFRFYEHFNACQSLHNNNVHTAAVGSSETARQVNTISPQTI